MYTENDRVMALAGIFQAAQLTQQIAHRGMADTQAMTVSIGSLFIVDAEDVKTIYDGVSGLTMGLRQLRDQLSATGKRDTELTRYVIALIQLEYKLSRQPDRLTVISKEIKEASERLEQYSLLHAEILSQLAEIYEHTLSTMQPRIMVKGEPQYLQQPQNIIKIRSLLLAGIRSAMLWRQVGGRRRQILFSRKKLIDIAGRLLLSSESSALSS